MPAIEKLVRLWIEKADHDLGTATLTHTHIPAYRDTICFHCQQAIEKYLKAYLLFLERDFKPVHDLVYLLDTAAAPDVFTPEFYVMANKVSGFAVHIRYPERIIEPTDEEVISALAYAQRFREAIVNKINLSR